MTRTITDQFMREMITRSRGYCFTMLHTGPKWNDPDKDKIIWEHRRCNFQLRAEGALSIVCPVIDDGDVKGIGIFNASVGETKRIMDGDPGVKAGIFIYETHPCRSFPGDALPK
jgi:hypothetical protein